MTKFKYPEIQLDLKKHYSICKAGDNSNGLKYNLTSLIH
jgi:hypothetical protein